MERKIRAKRQTLSSPWLRSSSHIEERDGLRNADMRTLLPLAVPADKQAERALEVVCVQSAAARFESGTHRFSTRMDEAKYGRRDYAAPVAGT